MIFSIEPVINYFSNLILNGGAFVYIIIWLIMFLQVTILNIPAYVILSACVSIGIETLSFKYIAVVLSAYMAGCLLAYYIGRKFGKKAVKWAAGSEDEYDKWSKVLNQKGKWWYLVTVLFPMFPDDLLCIVAGAVKLHFGFYTIANLIGRGIGLTTMLLTLKLIGSLSAGGYLMLWIWAGALVIEIISWLIIRRKNEKHNSNR